jgi:hypothetical protein
MRRILFLIPVLIGLVATPALARERPNPFSSGEASLAYAIDPGCVAWLRMGGDMKTTLDHASRPVTEDGKEARKVYGMGHVTVRTDARGGCYVRVRYGDPVKLRETVVNTLAESGLKVERLPANEAQAGRNWGFRQETDCFRMDEKVYLIEIYAATTRRTIALQATLFPDAEGLAARNGLCSG